MAKSDNTAGTGHQSPPHPALGPPETMASRTFIFGTAILVVIVLTGIAWWQYWPQEEPAQEPSTARAIAEAAALDELKQEAIWDAEHVTFKIENRFGKPFMAAIVGGDAEQLAAQTLSGFLAALPGQEQSTTRTRAGVYEERRSLNQAVAPNQDANAFVSHLLASAARCETVQARRLQVLQIEGGKSETEWEVQALATIRGQDADGHDVILEVVHRFECTLVEDEQLGSSPILSRWWIESESFRRAAAPLFKEVSDDWGLSSLPLVDNWQVQPVLTRQYKFQMAVADYDRDGFLDVAIASYKGRPILLKNVRGRQFVDVTQQMGLAAWDSQGDKVNSLAGWIDLEGDGFPDLVLGGRLYANREGRSFRDVTAESGLSWKREPMGMVVADYDCDGRLDIYVLYQMRSGGHKKGDVVPWVGDSESGVTNVLWRNEGNSHFQNVSEASGSGAGKRKSFAANWLYFDDDHYPDLYVANDFGPNVLLRNKGDGTFEDLSDATRASDFATSMGVASGDLDNDGTVELYVANMYSKMGRRIIGHVGRDDYPAGIFEQIQGSCAGNRLYRYDADEQKYHDISVTAGVNTVGWAYAPAFVDVDSDGLLDLYATTGFMSFDRRKPDG